MASDKGDVAPSIDAIAIKFSIVMIGWLGANSSSINISTAKSDVAGSSNTVCIVVRRMTIVGSRLNVFAHSGEGARAESLAVNVEVGGSDGEHNGLICFFSNANFINFLIILLRYSQALNNYNTSFNRY